MSPTLEFFARHWLSIDGVIARPLDVLRRDVNGVSWLDAFSAFSALIVTNVMRFVIVLVTRLTVFNPDQRRNTKCSVRSVVCGWLFVHIPVVLVAFGVGESPPCIRSVEAGDIKHVGVALKDIRTYGERRHWHKPALYAERAA